MTLVSVDLQHALMPIFQTGSEKEQALLWRVEQEPLLLFDAVSQDLLGLVSHLNELFPASDHEIISSLKYLAGQSVTDDRSIIEGPIAPPEVFADDVGSAHE